MQAGIAQQHISFAQPMKRLFTLITILITLSLIGIIVLQLSWIKNSLLLKEDQTIQAIESAMFDVSQELIEEKVNCLP